MNNKEKDSRKIYFLCIACIVAAIASVTMNNTYMTAKIDLAPIEKQKLVPKVEVPVNLKIEENSQKSVDEGHSPWRLDPVFVAQVFVSLKISPEGIKGDYPIKYEELKILKENEKEAVVEVTVSKTPIKRVYLKRLIRQDDTGIWTVVGYDPFI